MRVQVILPPDYIGAPEVTFELEVAVEPPLGPQDAAYRARSLLENTTLDVISDLPGRKRTLTVGDVLVVADEHFIVERTGLRRVSGHFSLRWRSRSLAERLLGSGEHVRVFAQEPLIPANPQGQ